jgi:hypothetical protein
MSSDWLARFAIGAYLTVLTLICIYGAHRYFLVLLYYRVRGRVPQPRARFDDPPPVTVQLPM